MGALEQTVRRPRRSWELWRPWQVVFVAVASSQPLQPEPFYPPPKKNILGETYGVSGALTGLGSEPEVLTGHDGRTTALLGLDVESGALTGWTQEPPPLRHF